MYNLQHIRFLADKKKLKLKEICEAAGMTDMGLRNSINNQSINIKALDKIADILDVSISELISDSRLNDANSSEPPPLYGKEKMNDPYKVLFEMQKEITEIIKENAELKIENERLKNVNAPVQDARVG